MLRRLSGIYFKLCAKEEATNRSAPVENIRLLTCLWKFLIYESKKDPTCRNIKIKRKFRHGPCNHIGTLYLSVAGLDIKLMAFFKLLTNIP